MTSRPLRPEDLASPDGSVGIEVFDGPDRFAVDLTAQGGGGSIPGVPPAAGANPFAQGSVADGGAITSTGNGSFSQGYANAANIGAAGSGSFAAGYVTDGGVISADAPGSFAQGYSYHAAAVLRAGSAGSFVQGYVNGGCSVKTNGAAGAFAQGLARQSGAYITAFGGGAFAQGYAYGGGTIRSGGHGSFAQGFTYDGGTIDSGDKGSFAQGYATTDQTVSATAPNAAQFGPGTNAQHDSFQVGSAGIRILGTVGPADGTPQNGDIYVASTGHVVIHSNGAAVVI